MKKKKYYYKCFKCNTKYISDDISSSKKICMPGLQTTLYYVECPSCKNINNQLRETKWYDFIKIRR